MIYLSGPVGAGNLEAALTLARARQVYPGAASVAQTSKSAVSRVSKPAGRACSRGQPTGKSATQQVWKPALPLTGIPLRLPLRQRESTFIRRYASACIDTSDGVCAALNTIADVNGCGYVVADLPYLPMGLAFCCRTSLPKALLFLGECGEYELLFTLHPERESAFLAKAAASGLEFHRLGRLTDEARTLEEDGHVLDLRRFRLQARDYPAPEQYLDALLRWLKNELAHQGRHKNGS